MAHRPTPADDTRTPREKLELAHAALTSLLGTMRDYAFEARTAASKSREAASIGSGIREEATTLRNRALEIEDELQQCQRTASRIGRLLGVEP